MMKKIRVAQIGTSAYGHGNHIWESMLAQSDLFEVVGYAFPENEREKFPKQAKRFDGYREMTVEEILSDETIEAVAVETEEIYLTKYALMVARAGKHLHMEKPGGTDLRDFEMLIGTLKANNLVFSTGYMYRHNPMVQEALAKVKRGELGKICSVEMQMDCYHPAAVRKWLDAFPGGMMFYLGCHLIDLIYQIQGEPQEIVSFNCSSGFDGVSSKDFGMAVFKYENGVSFAKTIAVHRGGFLRRRLVICGELGTIEIGPLEAYCEGGLYTVMSESYTVGWGDAPKVTESAPYRRYDGMMKNFAEMVRGKENPYSYDYELSLYRLLQRACNEGKIV